MGSHLNNSFPDAALPGLEPVFCSDVKGSDELSMILEALTIFSLQRQLFSPILGRGA